MRFSVIFLFATAISASAFAQTGLRSDVKKDTPIYPPSAPTNISTPSAAAGVVPQSAPVAPATLGVPAAPAAPADPTQSQQQPAPMPGNGTAPLPGAATAQQPAPVPGNGTAVAAPATGGGTVIQAAPATSTTTTTIAPAKTTKKDAFPNAGGEEIGFDPKVKRDPYGNIIGADTSKSGTKSDTGAVLRGDTNAELRSDSKIKMPPVKPVQPTGVAPAGSAAGAKSPNPWSGSTNTRPPAGFVRETNTSPTGAQTPKQ